LGDVIEGGGEHGLEDALCVYPPELGTAVIAEAINRLDRFSCSHHIASRLHHRSNGVPGKCSPFEFVGIQAAEQAAIDWPALSDRTDFSEALSSSQFVSFRCLGRSQQPRVKLVHRRPHGGA